MQVIIIYVSRNKSTFPNIQQIHIKKTFILKKIFICAVHVFEFTIKKIQVELQLKN